jgi:hypothetical protein
MDVKTGTRPDELPRITPGELRSRLHAGQRPLVLDVRRQPDDRQIPGATRTDPVHLLETFNPKLDAEPDSLIITYCA